MDVMTSNYEQQLIALEEQELESEDTPSVNLYTQLLALYVLLDDLPSAKLLWKRLPQELKQEPESDLQQVWNLATIMIRSSLREIPQVYVIIRGRSWPHFIEKIVGQIALHVKERMISLISQTYSHIRLEDVARFTGCATEVEATSLVSSLGWTFDETSPAFVIVNSKKTTPSTNGGLFASIESASFDSADYDEDDGKDNLSREQLHRLTEYVAFLENH